MTGQSGLNLGDWWEPIATAPKDGRRLLLVIPPADRERRLGEPKSKNKKQGDRIIRPAQVRVGIWLMGTWASGRHAPQPFFDDPTHWMNLPDLPDEYLN